MASGKNGNSMRMAHEPRQTRQLLAEIGICDDRQEKTLLMMPAKKGEAIELERAKAPDQVWALENRLVEAER